MASSSLSNGIMASTGPKISSRMMVMSGIASAKTVGFANQPLFRPSPSRAAGNQSCPFIDPGLDQPLNLVELHLRDERTDVTTGLARKVDNCRLGGGLATLTARS